LVAPQLAAHQRQRVGKGGLVLVVPGRLAHRGWAVPVLTALAPAARDHQERGRRHKQLTDGARQLLLLVRRGLPDRQMVGVAASTASVLAVLAVLARCAGLCRPSTVVTRWRLDAALDEPAPPQPPGTRGRPRRNGPRRPTWAARLAAPTPRWTTITVPPWYSQGPRPVEIVSQPAGW
jgi:hypothetical protein